MKTKLYFIIIFLVVNVIGYIGSFETDLSRRYIHIFLVGLGISLLREQTKKMKSSKKHP